jgi:hypothetical protein
MNGKTPSKKVSRLRFQISISSTSAQLWKQLAALDRRNRSNMLEVLIERAHQQAKAQP